MNRSTNDKILRYLEELFIIEHFEWCKSRDAYFSGNLRIMKKLFTTSINSHGISEKPFELQNCRSSYVAAFGFNQSVDIFDRHGEKKLEIPLPGEAISMSWDADGDNLAIIDDKTSSATLWDSLSFKISQIHTGVR
ncbi:uncharacterized protein DC041_0006681 [Schistosoma bovis]|uniref:WDR19 first beta-propeller domain-containing protein n=1 Tax=Schistosoma bovis TaxID=6184 RepID=A0A430QCC7_SCHBO|nr:uncharacterized protein DC041_0006681 [Schistosoma bovis]